MEQSLNVHFTFVFPSSPPACSSQSSCCPGFSCIPCLGFGVCCLLLLSLCVPSASSSPLTPMSSSSSHKSDKFVQRDGQDGNQAVGSPGKMCTRELSNESLAGRNLPCSLAWCPLLEPQKASVPARSVVFGALELHLCSGVKEMIGL